MAVPAKSPGGDQQKLRFPPIEDNPHPPVEKDEFEAFGESISRDFIGSQTQIDKCPFCSMGELRWNGPASACVCDLPRRQTLYYKNEVNAMKISECSDEDVPLDTKLIRENEEIVDQTDRAVDVMLELSGRIYCSGCGVQGVKWSKGRAKWECRAGYLAAFGELSFTRYFVGKIEVLKDVAIPLLERPVVDSVKQSDKDEAAALRSNCIRSNTR